MKNSVPARNMQTYTIESVWNPMPTKTFCRYVSDIVTLTVIVFDISLLDENKIAKMQNDEFLIKFKTNQNKT